ncbi:MAG: PorV/PorQ family protein [Elusimicrobia bacterium]|nr:PorV/PorQ family protein [Elusimicrobiota bacterium]MBD3411702.1 PorV/PorQ family protein [Elusimicrobiota bacterium]
MKKILLILILLNTGINSITFAGVGTTSAEFLLIPVGSRPAALAGTYAAVSDDIYAMSYNPAGLVFIENKELGLMHCLWLISTRFDYLAYAQPFSFGTIGVGISYLNSGSMTGRTIMGQQTGSFKSYDTAASISYARALTNFCTIGFTGRYIRQTIDTVSRTGICGDIGFICSAVPDRISIGGSIMHIGPQLSAFDTQKENLPTTYRMGVGLWFFEKNLLFSGDIKKIIHDKTHVSMGIEYCFKDRISLRIGSECGSSKDHTPITSGVGFHLWHYYIDYCFEPFKDLDITHRISLRTVF